MDLARGLITSLVDEDRYNAVSRSGITTEYLNDEDCSSVFAYIQRHYVEYSKVPSRDAVKQVFPNFDFTSYQEPLEYFIDEIKETYRKRVLEDKLIDINRCYTRSTQEAEELMREALQELTVTTKSFKDLNLADTSEDRFAEYLRRKDNPGADGVLSGWDKVDYVTLGWHRGELIVLVGEKYQGKTWLLLWLAYQAFLAGERVLFVTREMGPEAVSKRFDSIYAGVKFDSLRRGELSEVEEKRFETRLRGFGKQEKEGSFVVARHGIHTISDIQQKAVETDATIVIVDSVYLFNAEAHDRSGNETQRRMAVSQKCKLIAQELDMPVIVSTQAGRKKSKKAEPDIDNIEWSNAFAQDADTVMMLMKDDIDKELNRCWIHVLKCRDGDTVQASIKTDFEYMNFEQDNTSYVPSYDIDIDEGQGMDL